MDFTTAPANAEEILRVIARTGSGRRALEEFLPLLHSRKVRIEAYPLELVEKLREAIGPDQPIGACFMNDGETGTIYIDLSSPLGVLAPFLFHEMLHSLDRAIWSAGRKPSDDVLLHSEMRAFEGQRLLMDELSSRYPEYRAFLAEQFPRARILHDRLTATDISELYGFKAS